MYFETDVSVDFPLLPQCSKRSMKEVHSTLPEILVYQSVFKRKTSNVMDIYFDECPKITNMYMVKSKILGVTTFLCIYTFYFKKISYKTGFTLLDFGLSAVFVYRILLLYIYRTHKEGLLYSCSFIKLITKTNIFLIYFHTFVEICKFLSSSFKY